MPSARLGEGDEDAKLVSAIRSSLELAQSLRLGSISLPAISTGIFGFPLERAVKLILTEIRHVLGTGERTTLKQVRLCIFDERTLAVFDSRWDEVWSNP